MRLNHGRRLELIADAPFGQIVVERRDSSPGGPLDAEVISTKDRFVCDNGEMPRRTDVLDSSFAGLYGLTRTRTDDWYDPLLHRDTPLYVDPFLMFEETDEPWSTVHDRLIQFFNHALKSLASARKDETSRHWRLAATMLSFPEPAHFCLGHGKEKIHGSGTGRELGGSMIDAAQKAIDSGIEGVTDFGEIMIFGRFFGRDRISDMACDVVKDLFVDYTATVAARHEVPTTAILVDHLGFDFDKNRWRRKVVNIPGNPLWDPDPGILLVPERFIDEIPAMGGQQFWDWVYDNRNEQLRKELGILIADGIDREEILRRAQSRPLVARKFGVDYVADRRSRPPTPYDLGADRHFVRGGFDTAQRFAEEAQVEVPASDSDFCRFMESLAAEFKWLVEDGGVWDDFWSADSPRHEPKSQLVFRRSIALLCRRLGVDVSPESNAGNGPVDFKFTASYEDRAIVEVKHAKSSTFWDNLEEQPPAYMKAEGVRCGIFLVIQHYNEDCDEAFEQRARECVAEVGARLDYDYSVVFVDARRKATASKRRRSRGGRSR